MRFLPSIVAEKNVTKNILDGGKDGRMDRGKTVYSPPVERGDKNTPQIALGNIFLSKLMLGSIKLVQLFHFLLKCLYQARKVSGYVFVCYRNPFSTIFFLFHFITSIIDFSSGSVVHGQ